MQLFNSLPPDQQQAILQRLGQGGGTSSGIRGLSSGSLSGSSGGYNSSQSALLQQQMLQQQRRQQNQDQQEENPFLPPVFKPGDTVLVDISLQGEMQNNGNPVNGQYNPQNARQSGYPNAAQTNGTIPTDRKSTRLNSSHANIS